MSELIPWWCPDCPLEECVRFVAQGFPEGAWGVVYRGGTVPSGVPLGGLGTGYVELESGGHFGATTASNNWPQPRRLDVPWLAVCAEGRVWVVSSDPPPGVQAAKVQRYWGHFPVADLTVGAAMPIEVRLRCWSPFVLGDARASNIPAAIFDITFRNVGASPVEVRGVVSWPGLEPQENQELEAREVQPAEGWAGVMVMDRGRGQRRHGGDAFCLAARVERGSSVQVGGALSEGDWARLVIEKELPALRGPGGSVAVSVGVPGGAEVSVRFVLSWHSEWFRDSDYQPHRHSYSFRFSGPEEVVAHLAREGDALLDRTLRWQRGIYGSELPPWLKDWLVNSLYSLAKNTLWVRSDRPDDWWGEEGIFTHSESFTGCPITETMVCRFHGHFPTLFFFPGLERTTLREFAHYQLRSGEVPFCFGKPAGLFSPLYCCQHPINSTEWVMLVHRYFLRTGDRELLESLYPAIKDAIHFASTLDSDQDGLVNEHAHAPEGEHFPANQFYDIWPWYGTSAYVAGIWLAALESGQALAKVVGDAGFASWCQQTLERGLAAFEEKLWTGSYYRLYRDDVTGRRSDTCLANQLMGEWCVRVLGLPFLFRQERIESALGSILRLNFAATDHGLVNGCTPEGRADTTSTHASEVFVGECLCAAMTMIYSGRAEEGLEVARRLYEAIALTHRSQWNQHCLIRASDGGPSWGSDYYSDLVVWALPMALAQQDLAGFSRGNFLRRLTQSEV